MQKIVALCGLTFFCLVTAISRGQSVGFLGDNNPVMTPNLNSLQTRVEGLSEQLTDQTQRMLRVMARREARLQAKLARVDSAAAKNLFAGSAEKYAALGQKMKNDSGNARSQASGIYLPYLDSLKGSVSFLQQNPQLLQSGASALPQLQRVSTQLQTLQARMQDADAVKAYVQQRKQQIEQYIVQHTDVQKVLGNSFSGMKQDIYYYSQQLRDYKEMWNSPDKLEKNMLGLLNRVPAFQNFMKDHSMLGSLFHLPADYGSSQALAGLQTRDQVAKQVQDKVAAGGEGGSAALQSNLQAAESNLNDYKSKLSSLGAGNGDVEMPNFKPNDQRTKTFLNRLEYGANFQTTRNNYMFPTVTDFGLSLGYKLGHGNVVGVGASYKLGWGNGIQQIRFSNEGVGLRSYLMVKLKGTFSASGGFEYNYTTPFTSFQQIRQLEYWTKSGLVGVTKTVSMKSRVFKKTTLSLLWDFLSYQQVPKTQPILFRIGYLWK